MEEIWKDAKGYEELYQVSNLGRIKSFSRKGKTEYILKPYLNKKNKYLYIHLSKKGITKLIRMHKLVAEAFIPNPLNKPYINHKDGNKQNNNINNLEWVTQKENIIHARDILKVDYSKNIKIAHIKNQRKVIRSDGKIYNSIKEAKEDMKNDNAHIVEVCQGKLKTTCGYGWRYLKEGV